ncbi:MAG: hypothetical protein QGF46_02075 [Planctomycetota bacterium]|jgi:hypothetical protein|nr:hypothetical protein [Planctomycetota bacterium]
MLHILNALFFIAISVVLGRALLPSQKIIARSKTEELALSYTLGLGAIILICNLAFVANLTLGFAALVIIAAAVFGFVYQQRRRESCAPPILPMNLSLVVLGFGLLSVIATVAYPINEFDAIYHWAYRGKILLFEGTPLNEAITGITSSDNFGRVVTHPNYPLGVPIIQALSSILSGWSDRWVQLPLALWAATMPWLVSFGLRNLPTNAIKVAAIATAVTPIMYVSNFTENGFQDFSAAGTSSSMMLGGGADLALMCMLTLSASLFLQASNTNCKRLAICAGMALAASASMKNEGLALLMVSMLACGIALIFKNGPTRIVSFFGLTAIICVAPWMGIRGQIPAIDENYSSQLTFDNFIHFASGGAELVEKSPMAMSGRPQTDNKDIPTRRSLVAAAFVDEFSDWRSWGLLWVMTLFGIGLLFKNFTSFNYRWLTLVVVGGVLLYFLILLVTPWNFPSLRDKGIPERLLVHLVGPIMLLFGHSAASDRLK